ncbi:SDR family NAD(P)-dependent oxidoreductase [Fodinibius sediminis]|uniref:NAD(P)-dependent dehydrogenase, short-chain alcohol dehydrogenase family n=1 Tax=Fodinibius sediminis TaxID=1214077 RepID=A0A521D4E3_9BACT|nr:SDR family oxidoreductase [Fodinibius sediminis]SMO66583.1 NAD(P)-dependent dehydrogenase, short-chain alcohol dehydrogenase family [Fodinibius sediminis]
MKKLKNKVALITGGTRGMGRAVAELFAKEGASVVINGRNKKLGEEVAGSIVARGGTATFMAADIRTPEANRQLVKKAVQTYGRLDILVPNAGMLGLGSVTEVKEETWHRTLDTNLNAVFYLLREAIPEMRKTDEPSSVVVTGSIAAHKGFPNHAAYCASKGAVESLVRQAAVDYAPDIRINLIQPGPVETKLYKDSAAAFPNADTILDEVPGSLPMKRVGSPSDIAQTVLFLASEDSSWITGSVITIDGGASAAG